MTVSISTCPVSVHRPARFASAPARTPRYVLTSAGGHAPVGSASAHCRHGGLTDRNAISNVSIRADPRSSRPRAAGRSTATPRRRPPASSSPTPTYKNSVNPSANLIGITDGPTTSPDLLHWLATSTSVPTLQGQTHPVATLKAGTLSLTIDGRPRCRRR
jgi:hypothetical protein